VGKDGKVDVTHSERVAIADQRINVWNPAFDVTPAEYIDAIITEKGEVLRGAGGTFSFRHVMSAERWRAAELHAKSGSDGAENGTVTSEESRLQFEMDV
jgi:methylthioribose-1-phosphate isomerase